MNEDTPHPPASDPPGPDRPATPRPSATLVLLRDAAAGLEVLLLRRGRRLSAFAGAWVFPGGVMERRDADGDPPQALLTAARTTAVRELKEETGMSLAPSDLVPLSRWTAPVVMPRRFDTWFFLAVAPRQRVRVDHGEIHDHRWIAPHAALCDHRRGGLRLFPPTWVTLHHLTAFKSGRDAMDAAAAGAPFHYAPKVVQEGATTCFLYAGDAAYTDLRLDAPGPRHRLWVQGSDWRYESAPARPATSR